MIKKLGIVLTLIVTSCFFFPFNPTFLPAANSKMIVAGFGLIALTLKMLKKNESGISPTILSLMLYAGAISILSFLTNIVHSTGDNSFTGYIMSFFVWTGAAYACITLMKKVHGFCNLELVCNYLIGVCVAQCIIALTMDYYSPLKQFVDSFVAGEGFMGKTEGRLYGIGCALDVAGTKFAAILIIIACLAINPYSKEKKNILWYLIAFSIVLVIGNMIGRTTTVGAALALAYWLYATGAYSTLVNSNTSKFWKWFAAILVLALPTVTYFYNTNAVFHENLRFGFEGFFNWIEYGKWVTGSNDILTEHMIVFPDNFNTWIFGDGYCANPRDVDPYYIGPDFHGFYMATDIGYCRFLFYFGIIGTLAMIAYIAKATERCIYLHPTYKIMFLFLFILNLAIWCKVSTDIYLVFAPFLVLSKENDEDYALETELEQTSSVENKLM